MNSQRPAFAMAIVDPNVLSALGLQHILTDIVPSIEVRVFISFDELVDSDETFAHCFVASRIYFEHVAFFRARPHMAIVTVAGDMQIQGVATLNVCQSEQMLVKSILKLHGHGHPGAHHVATQGAAMPTVLSSREVEVTVLLTKGYINKEIADQLCISVTTVITHRKNIMEKLHARSLADVVVYAVRHGLVNIDEL